MSRKSKNTLLMQEQFPFKNSPQSLTFGNEIKRVADEREEKISKTISILSEMSGVSERHIYNYRSGKTDIPSGLIPVFCNQFGSNALAMAILGQCGETKELDDFDIVKLANRSAQATLETHSKFLQAFEDGKIDGFEINELKESKAATVAHFNRLEQIAEDNHKRCRVA